MQLPSNHPTSASFSMSGFPWFRSGPAANFSTSIANGLGALWEAYFDLKPQTYEDWALAKVGTVLSAGAKDH